MDIKTIDTIISVERLKPYLLYHNANFDYAIEHYKANILISETFYPYIAILEVGLRNSVNVQLSKRFNDEFWFDNKEFLKNASNFQIDRLIKARNGLSHKKKKITSGKIVSELSFGFWTSLLDSRFEVSLWKSLRLSFPNCPKDIRKRKTMSAKFNTIRKLRNRIFHHEPITWNLKVLNDYNEQIIEGIRWLDKDLLCWSEEMFRYNEVVETNRNKIMKK